jgi:hypothetical protein
MVCVMGYNTFYTMSDGSHLVTRHSLHHVLPILLRVSTLYLDDCSSIGQTFAPNNRL